VGRGARSGLLICPDRISVPGSAEAPVESSGLRGGFSSGNQMSDIIKDESGETAALRSIRNFLLVIFLVGTLGTGAELFLVEHTEPTTQLVPLGLMAASLVVPGWRIFDRGRANIRAFQAVMILFVLSGFVGLCRKVCECRRSGAHGTVCLRADQSEYGER